MIARIVVLSIMSLSIVVAGPVFAPAEAQKLTLPVGDWGHDGLKGPDCKKPFLKIEDNRIIQRFDEGEGRCVVKSIRKKGGVLFIKTKCDWDASVPENLRDGADDDGASISIKVLNNKRILFSNTDFGLCNSSAGGGQ